MVVHAVGEEQALGIDREGFEVSAFAVALIILEDVLHGVAHAEVVLAVLVPEDVPAELRGFGEVIGVFLLLEGQAVPAGNLIAHHFQVREGIHGITERFFRFLFRAGADRGGGSQCDHHFKDRVHRVQFDAKL